MGLSSQFAVQKFRVEHGSDGSFASLRRAPRLHGMSAVPPTAAESVRRSAPLLRATSRRERMQQLRRYSITLSARASNMGGMAMPSALAVFRLMTNSNLTGACIGRSLGFAPRRMRST
jgi:hypothetical protein